jgi:hypothetical protein
MGYLATCKPPELGATSIITLRCQHASTHQATAA